MKRPPRWTLERMQEVIEYLNDEGPCNCEQALLLQRCVHLLLDWMDGESCTELPDIDLFDICAKASHWRER